MQDHFLMDLGIDDDELTVNAVPIIGNSSLFQEWK